MTRTSAFILFCFLLFSCKSQSQGEKTEKARALNNQAVQALQTNPDQALAYLDSAIALDSTTPASYLNKVTIWCSKGEYNKAIEDSKKALVIQPKLAEARMFLAMLYDRTNQPELAKREYESAAQTFTERLEKGSSNEQADKLNQAVTLICLGRRKAQPNFNN